MSLRQYALVDAKDEVNILVRVEGSEVSGFAIQE